MNLKDFQFELPKSLIAKFPAVKRSDSRLLRVGEGLALHHQVFNELLHHINAGDLLVFNDTKVIPARVFGKKATGGRVELLLERILDEKRMLAQLRASKALKVGDTIHLVDGSTLSVSGKVQQFYELVYEGDGSVLAMLQLQGEVPLPPYMERSPDASDKERYQTVYAKYDGSIAAPTAGLHFDEALLQALRDKGVQMAYLTLHIGAGTFAPIRCEDIQSHEMHAEYFQVSETLCAQVAETKAKGKRVIAVGTTSMRALESASRSGELSPFSGETRIFIYPGYTFRTVDALITNFHLPCSTLMMLICAFGGYERMMHAYQEAVAREYRFYSYGDAMLVERYLG